VVLLYRHHLLSLCCLENQQSPKMDQKIKKPPNLSVLELVVLLTGTPCEPVSPLLPAFPGFPCLPGAPSAPDRPDNPGLPCGPWMPVGPRFPCGPVAPTAPIFQLIMLNYSLSLEMASNSKFFFSSFIFDR
jgi:hypothetical protein